MTELIIAEEHSQLYDLWIEKGEKNLAICHVDFHCDMRGLLINRKLNTARFINQYIPYIHMRDPGSFLGHAIMEGVVTKIRWVHDVFGGRKYDPGAVKYENDLTALYHYLIPSKKVKIQFSEHTFDDWGGVQAGEHLDIDWDAIAFIEYDEVYIRKLMNEIINREYPKDLARVYLVLSPDYIHSNKKMFDEFIGRLEKKFNATAIQLPPYQPIPDVSKFWQQYRRFDNRIKSLLLKYNIY